MNTLNKFFTRYRDLFKQGMSTGDADAVLMDLIGIIGPDEVEFLQTDPYVLIYQKDGCAPGMAIVYRIEEILRLSAEGYKTIAIFTTKFVQNQLDLAKN